MTFMRAYQDMVFSTAARLTGNEAHAEDIAQDVFLRAFEHFSQLRGSPTAGGWLKSVAKNLALNHLTRYRRRWRFFSELTVSALENAAEAPEVNWEAADTLISGLDADRRRQLVDDALRRLPEHQRVVLALYHFEEMSYQEIAERLRISLAKVKIDIWRARNAMLGILRAGGLEGE